MKMLLKRCVLLAGFCLLPYLVTASDLSNPFGNMLFLESESSASTVSNGDVGRIPRQLAVDPLEREWGKPAKLDVSGWEPNSYGISWVSADDLRILLLKDGDIYESSRRSRYASFDPPAKLGPTINTDGVFEGAAALSPDGLEIFFGRGDLGQIAAQKEVFCANRQAVGESFGVPGIIPTLMVRSAIASMWMGTDENSLYMGVLREGVPVHSIFRVSRTAKYMPFGDPVLVEGISSPQPSWTFSMSENEREAFYITYVDQPQRATSTLFMTTRTSIDDPFGNARPLPELFGDLPNAHAVFTNARADRLYLSRAGMNYTMERYHRIVENYIEEFSTSPAGWEFASPAFDPGLSLYDAVRGLTLTTTTNRTFGFWESPIYFAAPPSSMAEPIVEYTFALSCDVIDPERIPEFRVRAFDPDFGQTNLLTIASVGQRFHHLPGVDAREYHLYVPVPGTGRESRLAFDVTNFSNEDEAVANFSLSGMSSKIIGDLEFVNLSTLDFRNSANGFEFVTVEDEIPPAEIANITEKGLYIAGKLPDEARNHYDEPALFGFWSGELSDVTLGEGALYRVRWRMSTTAAADSLASVPAFRLRVNATTQEFGSILVVNSTESTGMPAAGMNRQYEMYFRVPAGVVDAGAILSFDYLYSEGLNDDPSIGIFLEQVEIARAVQQ